MKIFKKFFKCGVKPDRHGSVATTISSRYKSDPLGSGSRKCSHSSWSRDEDGPLPKLSLTDEDNYLMPIKKLGLFLDEEIEKFGEEDEEEENYDDENATLYTPVVEGRSDTIKSLFLLKVRTRPWGQLLDGLSS